MDKLIRPVDIATDSAEWLRMRLALWPHHDADEMRADMRSWLDEPNSATFVAVRANGNLCGFIEVGQRKYAEGCESSPVGYIEGWYVDADVRGQGVGKCSDGGRRLGTGAGFGRDCIRYLAR